MTEVFKKMVANPSSMIIAILSFTANGSRPGRTNRMIDSTQSGANCAPRCRKSNYLDHLWQFACTVFEGTFNSARRYV